MVKSNKVLIIDNTLWVCKVSSLGEAGKEYIRILCTNSETFQFSSVQFGRSVMPDSLWRHGLQHARPPCLSPTSRTCSTSCLSSQWCHLTISSSVVPSPPAFNLSQHQGVFQWVSSSNQVAKVLEFQLQHQSFNEYSGLISFRMDWFDPLVVQGTLRSLLQHHSSLMPKHQFFGPQLSL